MPADPKPPGGTPDPNPNPNPAPPAGGTPEVAELAKKISSLESYIEELKTEAIQNRQKAKASSTVLENLRTALGIEGDASTVEAKVKDAVAGRDTAIKQLVLERDVERAAVKAGLRGPALARAVALIDMNGIEVDAATRTVKGDLSAKFNALKSEIPELFGVTPAAGQPPKPPAGTQDPGTPPPPPAGSVLDQWETAKAKGDRLAMAQLMREHGAEIGRAADSLPRRA